MIYVTGFLVIFICFVRDFQGNLFIPPSRQIRWLSSRQLRYLHKENPQIYFIISVLYMSK